MKLTLEEQIRNDLIRFGRKSKRNRAIAIPTLYFVMFLFHLRDYLLGNGKRFAMMFMSVFLFAVYSSFSFPTFITSEEDYSLQDGDLFASDIELAEETDINLDTMELYSDEDVIAGSENGQTSHGYAADTYDAAEILEASDGVIDSIADEGEQEEEKNHTTTFTSDDWRLILINKQNSIPDDYEFPLGTIKGSMKCDKRILSDLLAMLQAASDDGVELTICSPYRDMEYQEMLFNRKIKRYMNKGMSYMEAYQLSSQAVTVPGASEHQIGLSLDIYCPTYTSLNAGFGDTQAGKWLKEHSKEYGFILRYPLGKEDITGIEYEPWHFRYVGIDAAEIIMDEGITLEEFWEEYVEDVSID